MELRCDMVGVDAGEAGAVGGEMGSAVEERSAFAEESMEPQAIVPEPFGEPRVKGPAYCAPRHGLTQRRASILPES